MNIEYLMHQIIETYEKVDNDLDLLSEISSNSEKPGVTQTIEDRIMSNIELVTNLKIILANQVIKAFTGKDVSDNEDCGYAEKA